jgi:hypothetical protein
MMVMENPHKLRVIRFIRRFLELFVQIYVALNIFLFYLWLLIRHIDDQGIIVQFFP